MAEESDLDALRAVVARLASSVHALSQAHRELHGIVSEFDATVRLARQDFEVARELMERFNPERIESRFKTLEADQVRIDNDVIGVEKKLAGHGEALFGGEKSIGLAHGMRWIIGIGATLLATAVGNLVLTIVWRAGP